MEKPNYDEMPELDEVALWIRESKQGKKYLSLIVKYKGETIKGVAFKNEEKKDNQPDYSFKKKEETDINKEIQDAIL